MQSLDLNIMTETIITNESNMVPDENEASLPCLSRDLGPDDLQEGIKFHSFGDTLKTIKLAR